MAPEIAQGDHQAVRQDGCDDAVQGRDEIRRKDGEAVLRGPERAAGDGLLVRREREAPEEAAPVRLLGLVDELRVADPVRADGRDRDAALRDLRRQRAAVAQEERFRRRICREVRDGLERRTRGNLEHTAAALHVRQHPLRELRRRAAVQRDHAPRRRRPDVRRHPDTAKASRIDEPSHRHRLHRKRRRERLQRGFLRQVQRKDATRQSHLRRQLPQPLLTPRHEPERINRLMRQEPSEFPSEPTRSTRDECNALFIRHPYYLSSHCENSFFIYNRLYWRESYALILIVVLIPRRELAQPLFNRRRRLEVKVALQFTHIRIRLIDIARLHGQELLLRRLTDGLFQHLDEVHELLRLVVADVVDLVAVAKLIHLRRIAKHMLNARDDVVDIGEVAVHIAVVVDLDGLAPADLVGELEIRHIRTAERPVDREEAQPRRWNAVEMAVSVRHELIRLLRRRIEADRMVDIVRRRERRLLLVAVDRRARSKEQMLHLMMAARLENVEKADDVRVDIRARMVDAVPHTSLRREVDDNVRLILLEQRRDRRLIRQVALDKRECRILAQNLQPALLQADIIVIIEIIKADNRRPKPQQPLRQMKADKSRSAGDQDLFRRIKW